MKVIVLCAVLAVVGADLATDMMKLATANTDFALQLYNKVRDNPEVVNMFFSPISISTAFAMVELGSAGKSKTEIDKVLGFEAITGDVHALFKALNTVLYNTSNPYTLRSANRLYGKKDFEFKGKYLEDTQKFYNATLQPMDFAGDKMGSVKTINEWVEMKTENKIKDLVSPDSITARTVLYLVNAIYFKGLWKDGFEFNPNSTETMDFHVTNEKKVNVSMMYKKARYTHVQDDEMKVSLLGVPYEGDLGFYIILPHESTNLGAVEDAMNVEALNMLVNKMQTKSVKLWMPKFKLEDVRIKLVDPLKALGMNDVFTTSADLSGIGGNPGDLAVTSAIHEAFINVDETGTEAAAATGIGISLTAILNEPEFKANRPFMFMIRENTSGTILFIGRLQDPSHEPPPKPTMGPDTATVKDTASSAHMSLVSLAVACIISLFK